jgi:hypothetical protein
MFSPATISVLLADRPAEPSRRSRRRSSRRSTPIRPSLPGGVLAIRSAVAGDSASLRRLSELEGRRLPEGRPLVAEVDGVVVAAMHADSGAVVADPFVHTAAVVDLLRVRSRQLIARRPRGRRVATPAFA